mmetsp:Transcript_11706/g.37166  ORF Transcript_11706/g.37166 Transcript_11706/m.37166 type:complete len:233 (-) Transcript_11706:44-742(-)
MGPGDLVHRAQQHRARRQAAPHRAPPRLRAHARLDARRPARGGRARQHHHLARREGSPRRRGAPLRREQRRATPARPGRAPCRARRGPCRTAARRPVVRDARPRPRRDGVKGGPGQRRGDGGDSRGREVGVLQARRRLTLRSQARPVRPCRLGGGGGCDRAEALCGVRHRRRGARLRKGAARQAVRRADGTRLLPAARGLPGGQGAGLLHGVSGLDSSSRETAGDCGRSGER